MGIYSRFVHEKKSHVRGIFRAMLSSFHVTKPGNISSEHSHRERKKVRRKKTYSHGSNNFEFIAMGTLLNSKAGFIYMVGIESA